MKRLVVFLGAILVAGGSFALAPAPASAQTSWATTASQPFGCTTPKGSSPSGGVYDVCNTFTGNGRTITVGVGTTSSGSLTRTHGWAASGGTGANDTGANIICYKGTDWGTPNTVYGRTGGNLRAPSNSWAYTGAVIQWQNAAGDMGTVYRPDYVWLITDQTGLSSGSTESQKCSTTDPGAPAPPWTACNVTGASATWGETPQAGQAYELVVTFTGSTRRLVFDFGDGSTDPLELTSTAPALLTSPATFSVTFPARASYDWSVACYLEDGTTAGAGAWGGGSDVLDPEPDDGFGIGECFSGLNIVKGFGCVLRWAFIPQQGMRLDELEAAANGGVLGVPLQGVLMLQNVWQNLEAGYEGPNGVDGSHCSGISVHVPMPGHPQGGFMLAPFSACPDSSPVASSIAKWVRLLGLVMLYVAAGVAVVNLWTRFVFNTSVLSGWAPVHAPTAEGEVGNADKANVRSGRRAQVEHQTSQSHSGGTGRHRGTPSDGRL